MQLYTASGFNGGSVASNLIATMISHKRKFDINRVKGPSKYLLNLYKARDEPEAQHNEEPMQNHEPEPEIDHGYEDFNVGVKRPKKPKAKAKDKGKTERELDELRRRKHEEQEKKREIKREKERERGKWRDHYTNMKTQLTALKDEYENSQNKYELSLRDENKKKRTPATLKRIGMMHDKFNDFSERMQEKHSGVVKYLKQHHIKFGEFDEGLQFLNKELKRFGG